MNSQNQEDILLRKANRVRARLLSVVDELDRKRHELSHPVKLVQRKVPRQVWVAAAVGAGLLVTGLVVASVRSSARRRRQNADSFPFGDRPEQPRELATDVTTRAARALLTFGLIQLGKVAIKKATRGLEHQSRVPRRIVSREALRPG